jgi:predicted nucleic acid-binding protein
LSLLTRSESSVAHAKSSGSISIVDSWGVLEWVYRNEPAASRFRSRLDAADEGNIQLLTSRITFGEINYNIRRRERRGEIPRHAYDFTSLPWRILSLDDALVDEAADLKTNFPISFADCFVAALAIRYNAPVITGDPDFQKLHAAGVLQLDWIGA